MSAKGKNMAHPIRGTVRLPTRLVVASVLLCGASVLASGCIEDRILDVDHVCGDGKRQGPEECDFLPDAGGSMGCVNCRVAPGFTCTDTGCAATCGDGRVAAPLEDCDPPDGTTCDTSCRAGTKTDACDMTGYWIARQTTFSIDNLVNSVATTSDWTAFEITQTGTAFEVKRAVACGLFVTGATTVLISDNAVRNLMWTNPQGTDVPAPRPPRRGTFASNGATCDFTMDRWYKVRGCDPARFLPPDFLAKPDLSTLPALPYEPDPINPAKGASIDGEVDIDADGYPGLAYILTGSITGVRHVVQRDWTEYYSDSKYTVAPNAIEFTVRSNFDNQENILALSSCQGTACNFINVGSRPSATLEHRTVFRYLGKDLSDPRVTHIITGALGQNLDVDFATCANVRAALPHDPSTQ